jgi:hypothetical protein
MGRVRVQTGDKVTLRVAPLGRHCAVLANDAMVEGAYAFRLESSVDGPTTLTVEAYVQPFHVGPDGRVQAETIEGYFVSPEDYEAFQAWRREKCK